MNPHDFETMLDAADSDRAELAMLLMGLCSFRVGELTKLHWSDIRESTHPDVELWFLPILGKDTRSRDTEGKIREVWLPQRAKDAIDDYCTVNRRNDDAPIFRASKRTLQKDITRSREHAVAKTGVDDYGLVSAHDFRAYFATNLALRENVKEEIVMELGGWDDRETFRHSYLDAQFDDIIQMHLAMAGVVDVESDIALTEYQVLRQEIQDLKAIIEGDLMDSIDDLELTIIDPRGQAKKPSDPDDTELDQFTG